MKTPRLLSSVALGAVLTAISSAQQAGWVSLASIDDELKLGKGETAFVVSVSQPIYLSIEPKDQAGRGIRLRPHMPASLIERPGRSYYERSEITAVGWHQPFPIAGPCTIRLGTAALVTMQVVSPQPVPQVSRR